MLSSHTKKVSSYGKRNQRIINVEKGSIFDDLVTPPLRPVVARMKGRENSLSVEKHRADTFIIPGPNASKLTQNTAKVRLVENTPPRKSTAMKTKAHVASKKSSPIRIPLTPQSTNIPNSPAFPGKVSHKRLPIGFGKGMPRKLTAFSPKVEVDIITLDDDGGVLKEEKRISPKAEHLPARPTTMKSLRIHSIISISSDDDSPIPQPRKTIHMKRHKIVVSDDDSASEENVEVLTKAPTPRPLRERKPSRPVATGQKTTHTKSTSPLLKPNVPETPLFVSDCEEEQLSVPSKPLPHKAHTPIPPRVSSRNARRQTSSSISPPVRTQTSEPTNVSGSGKPILPSGTFKPYVDKTPAPRRNSPLKTRRLTPIGRRKGAGFRVPSPALSLDLTDDLDLVDLTSEFEKLSTELAAHEMPDPAPVHPAYLRPLLEECGQTYCGTYEFSTFINTFRFDPIVQAAGGDMAFRKVGEASYSEVFGVGDVVLKIIPLRDEDLTTSQQNATDEQPFTTDAKDVQKEIIVTRAMCQVCQGFVKLLKAYVVRGRYPELLLDLWDEYFHRKGSESIRPGRSFIWFLKSAKCCSH
jgi:serine/threonine-protein kinase haspin